MTSDDVATVLREMATRERPWVRGDKMTATLLAGADEIERLRDECLRLRRTIDAAPLAGDLAGLGRWEGA